MACTIDGHVGFLMALTRPCDRLTSILVSDTFSLARNFSCSLPGL